MNDKYTTAGTLSLEHQSSSINLLAKLFRRIVYLNQVQRDIFDIVYKQIKILTQYFIIFIFATWLAFLGVGLCASIFGANLEQQIYSSRNKIDANDFIRQACGSKSNAGKIGQLNNKLLPDAAQCLGSEVVEFFR